METKRTTKIAILCLIRLNDGISACQIKEMLTHKTDTVIFQVLRELKDEGLVVGKKKGRLVKLSVTKECDKLLLFKGI